MASIDWIILPFIAVRVILYIHSGDDWQAGGSLSSAACLRFDTHGNTVYYQYERHGGHSCLRHIWYNSLVSGGDQTPQDGYKEPGKACISRTGQPVHEAPVASSWRLTFSSHLHGACCCAI